MKIVVYPHELIIGGSPINAIDLAATVAGRGHEVVVYGKPGPLNDYIDAKGLRFVAARPLRYRPGPSRIVQLARFARQESIDLIHAYEWPPTLDAYFGAHVVGGVPLLCTVLSMSLTGLVPDSVPLVTGTRELEAQARAERRGPVYLLEPPIDTDHDRPGLDGSAFRAEHGVEAGELLLVSVSRLSIDLKLDALVRAIDAAGRLARQLPVRLVVVGTGEAADQLARRAVRVNEGAGREVVTMAGPTLDPRPAYAAADVVLGMGSSALRAMAHGKPVVVQGERGFSLPCRPDTLERFSWQGFYGIGGASSDSGAILVDQLAAILGDARTREALGSFGRRTVVERYSLTGAAERLLAMYEQVPRARARPARLVRESAVMAGRALANEARLHLPSDKRTRRSHDTAALASAAEPAPGS